jgi:hypothetical protein
MTILGSDCKAHLQLWWADHSVSAGLGLSFVLVAILGILLVTPTGPATVVTGTIEGFGLRETDTGTYPIATVRLPDREITVTLSRSHRCVMGGQIKLQKQKRLWGQSFILDWNGCGRGR